MGNVTVITPEPPHWGQSGILPTTRPMVYVTFEPEPQQSVQTAVITTSVGVAV